MNEHIKELLLKVVPMEGEDGDLFPSLYTKKQIEEFAELVRQDEREACAKLCEELGMVTNGMYERNHECAKAILARGEK